MSYIDKNLMNGEEVIYKSNLHWIIFVSPIFWLISSIFFFSVGPDAALIGFVLFLTATIIGISSFINYQTSEFGVTNKRVIVKVGFIRRDSLEILLNKVESIQVNQGILGRILNFGSITLSGTGGTKDPFHKISSPLEFRRKAQEQIASFQRN